VSRRRKEDVIYECINCGAKVTLEELSRYGEIKCLCGYRIFKKSRPEIIKTVKAI